ncbi:hypothetical protein [Desulforamulus aquiferis]|uniref:Uncharacterized protein n=1 Tax=Desulforamulus aquiferis TaxID=1397668 RepID=A0AAW7Z9W0_9FIRM|nr:hypothetical protein [Desulforamulus aquiferis]MDO7786101.1 hypothetical protein [Desulforamulus aquiferis]
MKIEVAPHRCFRSSKRHDELGINITFIATATTKQDRQKLRKLWEELEENDSLMESLRTIESMTGEEEKNS